MTMYREDFQMRKSLMMCVVLGSAIVLVACGNEPPEPEMQQKNQETNDAVETSSQKPKKIEAILKDKEDEAMGEVTLQEEDNGVQLNVEVSHLQPGSYGIHIHEAGLCEAPSFESADGHYNPDDRKHGFYQQEGPHKGDMENLEVDEDGESEQMYVNEFVTLKKGEPNSLITEEGTSIVIHEKQDDYMTQPSGDSGDRIYCGVISPPAK